MTLTLTATASAADANVFCTLAEAEAYAETLVFPGSWSTATTAQKQAALVQAARLLNTLSWKGVRNSSTQAMAWPRCGEPCPVRFVGLTVEGTGYLYDQDGYVVPTDVVPQCVKDANAEFALRLLAKDRAADKSYSIAVGSIKTPDKARSLVPPSVYDLIRHFLASSPGNIKAVRG